MGADYSWSGSVRRLRGTDWRDEVGSPWRVSSARQDARWWRTRASQPKPGGRRTTKIGKCSLWRPFARLRSGHAALVATQRAMQDDLALACRVAQKASRRRCQVSWWPCCDVCVAVEPRRPLLANRSQRNMSLNNERPVLNPQ